jgi:hypothetical protein
MARSFATTVQRGRETYEVTGNECAWLVKQVEEFRQALATWRRPRTSTDAARMLKDAARERLEEIIRRIANQVRVNPRINPSDKALLRIKERPKRLKKRAVPLAAPVLQYLGYPPKAGANCGYHRLNFSEGYQFAQKSKPNGAVRVEIFADLVPQGQPIPQFPGQYLGGRPWYLRSFSRSPCKVKHPMPPVSMLVVYWARWADAQGNVGPFSQTCIARPEGGWALSGDVNRQLGPMPEVKVLDQDPKYMTTITQLRQIEQVTVQQQLLPDGTGRAETQPPKQLPMNDAA